MKKNSPVPARNLGNRSLAAFGRLYHLAYAEISPEYVITQTSANFRSVLVQEFETVEGRLLTEVLPEFVGTEDTLHLVLYKALPSLQVEMIRRDQPDGSFRFLTFHIFPLDEYTPGSGLLFLAEDVTRLGMIAQKLIHRRNEVRLMQETLAHAYEDLENLARSERQTAEEALSMANQELREAYDRTMEGWVRALDLRDNETEGHTLRVAEVTIKLARSMAVPESQILHIRRGALLHDIGKMGVPDRILLKEDKLTDEEWAIMRRHPVYAHEMLSPISYLRDAIDIPYCHHEKWDGSGYPRKLKGNQIPLSARLFTVVDVWDALLSRRTYRQGWPEEKVLDYIRSQSGIHFDPKVVETFLRVAVELAQER